MFKKIKNVHMIGIGGSGMSGIALVLNALGYSVSGSDLKTGDVTEYLRQKGIKIYSGHKASNIKDSNVVVYSSAIDKTNPEIIEAVKRKIPVIPRAEMLSEIARLKYTITVAGTHGKTSTTSLLGSVLEESGLDPTIIVGGKLKSLGAGGKSGDGDYLVAEADESDGSFLKLSPTITIVTNIDNDHLDFYNSFDSLEKAFMEHINSVPFYGYSVICADDPVISKCLQYIKRQYYTYAIDSPADYKACNIKQEGEKMYFTVNKGKDKIGSFSLNLFGRHNVLNALAVCACANELGVGMSHVAAAFDKFSGVGRRLEFMGKLGGVICYDDYAHHPSEIKSTLAAVKERFPERRIVCIFQPHRYSRTRLLYNEIAESLKSADVIYITEIYPAGEKAVSGINSGLILKALEKKGRGAVLTDYKSSYNEIMSALTDNDLFITLGAGDIYKLHSLFGIKHP